MILKLRNELYSIQGDVHYLKGYLQALEDDSYGIRAKALATLLTKKIDNLYEKVQNA